VLVLQAVHPLSGLLVLVDQAARCSLNPLPPESEKLKDTAISVAAQAREVGLALIEGAALSLR
jgi:hypothetical protein